MGDRRPRRRIVVQVIAMAAGLALLGACSSDDDQEAETEEVILLSAEDPGPSAFTPPVDTAPADGAPTGACDPQALLAELEARPEALREWAAVLDVPEEQVETYVATLEPEILDSDTRVTNHGLGDDGAFPLQATLAAGTAVLVDTSGGEERLVTRCRCGNPLLPPQEVAATTSTSGDSTTTTTYDDSTTTTYDDTTTTTEDVTTPTDTDDVAPDPSDDEPVPVDPGDPVD